MNETDMTATIASTPSEMVPVTPAPPRRRAAGTVKRTPAQATAKPRTVKADNSPQMGLDLWPDTVRGIPNAALRGSLFSISQVRPTAKKRELIAAVDGIEVRVKGERFNQSDLDVWEELIHMARGKAFGDRVQFSSNALLKALDRATGGTQHEQLADDIMRLRGTSVEVRWVKEGKKFVGGLISEYFYDENSQAYVVIFSEKMLKLFSEGYTRVDWEQRKLLKSNNLAKWLHAFYSSHAEPFDYKVETIRDLCGSKSEQRLTDFRKQLRVALEKLKTIGALLEWKIDPKSDLVAVRKKPSASQARHLEKRKERENNAAFNAPQDGFEHF